MKDLRSARRLIQNWHKREKAVLDHVARAIGAVADSGGRVHSPVTGTGLVVEEQIRKAWSPAQGGLPVF